MIRRRFREARGQSTVEFALAMPFILGFLLLVVDMGLLLFSYVSITNAVREGARCAAVGGAEAAVELRVSNTSTGLVDVSDVSVTRDGAVGGDVTVEASYTYDWLFPVGLIPGVDLANLTFSQAATMRMEQAPPYNAGCG